MSKEKKVHLHTGSKNRDNKTSILYACVDTVNARSVMVTKVLDDVTCKNCERTNEYKRLESEATEKLKQSVMQIGVDTMGSHHKDEERRANSHKMAEMFEAEIAKDSEPKTYKQKIEIEVDMPVGCEFDYAKVVSIGKNNIKNSDHATALIQFKKKAKTGAELLHCLVGYSDVSLDIAKDNTIDFARVGIVDGYNFSQNKSYRINGKLAMYAYPVPTEKLAELKANLEREV